MMHASISLPSQLSQPRCVKTLETAVDTLEKQFEACEMVKLDVGDLRDLPTKGDVAKELHGQQKYIPI